MRVLALERIQYTGWPKKSGTSSRNLVQYKQIMFFGEFKLAKFSLLTS